MKNLEGFIRNSNEGCSLGMMRFADLRLDRYGRGVPDMGHTPRPTRSCVWGLLERRDRLGFIIEDVEDRDDLGDLEDTVEF